MRSGAGSPAEGAIAGQYGARIYEPQRQNGLGFLCLHIILCGMATNLDLDAVQLQELMRLGGFRSKREAVDAAVREALAWRLQERAREALGTIEFLPVVGTEAAGDAP